MEDSQLNLEELRHFFDAHLKSIGRQALSLRSANKLLSDNARFNSVNLKELLETGQYHHAFKTSSSPRQWYILSSQIQKETLNIDQLLNDLKKPAQKHNQTNYKKGCVIFLLLFSFISILTYFFTNDMKDVKDNNIVDPHTQDTASMETEEIKTDSEIPDATPVNPFLGKIFTLRSTYNDKEIGGKIIQTNYEVCYDSFDFVKMQVVSSMPSSQGRIQITYPISGFYTEGVLSINYVFIINANGVKEIWFNPSVPNYGFDYMDGSRIACYDVKILN